MRLRAGLILFISIAVLLVVGGCRKPLAPTFDRNQAPETWITAAPLDTITYREGPTPRQTDPAYIPFRFHMYWAGSDPDGKVVGFYYAVVETLPLPIPPAVTVPPLPGPKPQDYRFTTKTDSTFIFTVSPERRDREHIFYIYAVDNLGRPDPTPARFIFNSIDRFKPRPVIDSLVAAGFVWAQDPNTLVLTRTLQRVYVPSTDTFAIGQQPKTTVPAGSQLAIGWHSEETTFDNPAVGYSYKLDEPVFVNVPATTRTVSYNTGPDDAVGPGVKVFRLRAIDRANGADETTRLFQMNNPPITWFSGPDRNAAVWTRGANPRDYYVDVPNWSTGIPDLRTAGLLSADSVKVMPSQRPKRRTFYEIYRNQIFARAEFDTVNMNSWVIFHNGGFDSDSPYEVVYRINDPRAPDSSGNPVLQIRPPNGSPIGFRSRIPASLWPTGQATAPSQTALYPNFDPASVNRLPTIAGYWGMSQSGTAYLFARAEDGNGELDRRIGSSVKLQPQAIVRAVDSTGTADADQMALRPLVIVFYVNKSPFLNLGLTQYQPKPENSPPYGRNINIFMTPNDVDQFDPGSPVPPGGPTSTPVFRYQIRFRAQRNGGAPTDSVTFAPQVLNRVPALPSSITLPDSLGGNRVRVMIELCDCAQCENVPGQGRCSIYSYFINVTAPTAPPAATTGSPEPGDAVLVNKKRGTE